jgi:ABC-2 type transport system permease protein
MTIPRPPLGLVRLHMRGKLQYRSDFIIQILAAVLRQGTWICFASILLSRIPQMDGWGFWDIVFLYGMSTIALGLCVILFDGAWKLPDQVRTGEFDALLVRPIDPMLHVFAQEMSIHGLGDTALGCGLVVSAAFHVHFVYGIWSILLIPAFAFSGSVIYGSLTLICVSISFWIIDIGSTVPMFINQLSNFARFPLGIFPPVLSWTLTWILPFAFIAFLPSSFLLGRGGTALGACGFVVAGACWAIARFVFKRGLMRYESTGA